MKINSVVIIDRAELRKKLSKLTVSSNVLLEDLEHREALKPTDKEWKEQCLTIREEYCLLEGEANAIRELLK